MNYQSASHQTEQVLTNLVSLQEFKQVATNLKEKSQFSEEEFLKKSISVFEPFIITLIEENDTESNGAMRELASEIIKDLKSTLVEDTEEATRKRCLMIRGRMWVAMATAVADVVNMQGIQPMQDFRNSVLVDFFNTQIDANDENRSELIDIIVDVASQLESKTRGDNHTVDDRHNLTYVGQSLKVKPLVSGQADGVGVAQEEDYETLRRRYKSFFYPAVEMDETIEERVERIVVFPAEVNNVIPQEYKTRCAAVAKAIIEDIEKMPATIQKQEAHVDEIALMKIVDGTTGEQDPKRFLRLVANTMAKYITHSWVTPIAKKAKEDLYEVLLRDIGPHKADQVYARQAIWMRAALIAKNAAQMNGFPLAQGLMDDAAIGYLYAEIHEMFNGKEIEEVKVITAIMRIELVLSDQNLKKSEA